jgi:hypothetical protein
MPSWSLSLELSLIYTVEKHFFVSLFSLGAPALIYPVSALLSTKSTLSDLFKAFSALSLDLAVTHLSRIGLFLNKELWLLLFSL